MLKIRELGQLFQVKKEVQKMVLRGKYEYEIDYTALYSERFQCQPGSRQEMDVTIISL